MKKLIKILTVFLTLSVLVILAASPNYSVADDGFFDNKCEPGTFATDCVLIIVTGGGVFDCESGALDCENEP